LIYILYLNKGFGYVLPFGKHKGRTLAEVVEDAVLNAASCAVEDFGGDMDEGDWGDLEF